jgi:hypothetical protein
MTPIGHFMCASAVAGTLDVTKKDETTWCFLYYALFLVTFYVSALFFQPGVWAMHLHDWFGNIALIFFMIYWGRGDARKQCFVCLLIGGQILSAYTHMFDVLALKLTGSIPVGMWRPHNIFHTPFAAFLIPLITMPIVRLLTKGLSFKRIYFFLTLGYFLHIFADTVTYNYQIYPLWPLGSFHFAVIDAFQRPEVVSQWLGNPLYIFSEASKENIDGFIVYKAELMVNFLLAALFFAKTISDRLIGKIKVI